MLNGTAIPIPVNASTNQLTYATYDANGNMISGAGATLPYNTANHLSSATEVSGGTEYYSYDPTGKRIYRLKPDGVTEEWTLYGATGERLGVYSLGTYTFNPLRTDVRFAGRLILDANKAAFNDAVGTNRANSALFYPYGDEVTSTSNDHVKFGTYTRDSFTGLDYADQRDYASAYGRFNTADQYQASGVPKDPASWNRYSYATGDPVNLSDPHGNDSCEPEDPFCSDLLSSIDDGWGTAKCQFGYYLSEYNTCEALITPPPQQQQQQQQVQCSISLHERPVDLPLVGQVADHTNLSITGSFGPAITLEGGPSGGYLVGFQGPGEALAGTNPSSPTNAQVGGAFTGGAACTAASVIESKESAYNNSGDQRSIYDFSAIFSYNSNSFTYTLLNDVGLSSYFPEPGIYVTGNHVPGWGQIVPGLR